MVTLDKIYTRTGDEGTTSLAGGQRLPKNDLRIEAYGCVDELNAQIGLALSYFAGQHPELETMEEVLRKVQSHLFDLGSVLATLPEDRNEEGPVLPPDTIEALEQAMDRMNAKLPKLTSFVLPGGNLLNAALHVCRTVCRRAERRVIALEQDQPGSTPKVGLKLLNRLSDFLFVSARYVSYLLKKDEVLWTQYRKAKD